MNKKLDCVLLIDDDGATNFLHRVIVEQSGIANRVQIAQSGQEALEYLSHTTNDTKPDLIFLDINMPGMNGWEFLEKYKHLKDKQKPVLIMLSTSLNPDDATKAKEMKEVSDFKHKPLSKKLLEEVVTQYF